MWVDFDNDFEFEEHERILTDYPLATAGVLTEVDIVIPGNALPGTHRMRIGSNWQNPSSPDPCAILTYGEWEDYTLEVTGVPINYDALTVSIDMDVTMPPGDFIPKAIISPHAGYVYSGFTANIAHRILSNSRSKRTVVIGPSHHVYIDGISGSFMDTYETPCGELGIDRQYLDSLGKHFQIGFIEKAHKIEHSTETQIPFIKHYSPDSLIVELIYGQIDYRELSMIIKAILRDPDNSIVISSDLSHFHSLDRANRLDNICLAGIKDKNVDNRKWLRPRLAVIFEFCITD